MTSLVRAKQLVLLTNSVSAKKLVPGQLGACIKLVLIKSAWYVQESWLSYDLLGTCKTAGPLDQLRTCKKVGPLPTRIVDKVGSYQTSLVRARKLVMLWPAWYVQNSWSSWANSVRAKKLVPGQLGACIKLVLIKPAWYVKESWWSYDLLGTCKTAGPLDQLGKCKKVGSWPTRCVHKVGSYQISLVRGRMLVILWLAWYVQNSWSSWPTRSVQKSWSLANCVRA